MRRAIKSPIEERTIGGRLRELRTRRGLTQVDLASRLGMSQPLLSRYERGELRLHGALIAAFAKALHCKPEKILGLEALEETGIIKDRRFVRRLERIDRLSKRDKEALLGTIDAFLAKVS
jgi:transcriptional regulator with XRE-family HTH domain